jgi:hypothetical protein
MLTYFRKRQVQLISGVLAMFLGGWLSLFCQHCQAYAAIDNDLPRQESSDHCQQDTVPQETMNEQMLDNDCFGSCDEDNNNIIAADSLQTAAEKISNSYHANVFAYQRQNSPKSISQSLLSLNGSSLIFERACFLPLDRFCVQLK